MINAATIVRIPPPVQNTHAGTACKNHGLCQRALPGFLCAPLQIGLVLVAP
jgi:hypothetical protein